MGAATDGFNGAAKNAVSGSLGIAGSIRGAEFGMRFGPYGAFVGAVFGGVAGNYFGARAYDSDGLGNSELPKALLQEQRDWAHVPHQGFVGGAATVGAPVAAPVPYLSELAEYRQSLTDPFLVGASPLPFAGSFQQYEELTGHGQPFTLSGDIADRTGVDFVDPTSPLTANGVMQGYSFINGILLNTQSGQIAFGSPNGLSGSSADWSSNFSNNNLGSLDLSGLNQTAWSSWYDPYVP
ncbi:hypothetical protein, partial [Bradyrhizobium sp.]|uniref:hypothetical protein n=1 Tax=Bradyrhizobium sp. TaxID=376 RepID=UPI002734BAD3